nr:MAG TPA: hypothetical protein [Caudoviricetes sp.]
MFCIKHLFITFLILIPICEFVNHIFHILGFWRIV